MKMENATYNGINFTSLLFLLFLTLKLTHVIDWSWWWVTAPLWMPMAMIFGVAVVAGILFAIMHGWGNDHE